MIFFFAYFWRYNQFQAIVFGLKEGLLIKFFVVDIKNVVLKTFLAVGIICILGITGFCQTTQPVLLRNAGSFDVHYRVICTGNDCETVEMGDTMVLSGSAWETCGSLEFVGLQFVIPDGDNVTRYITFNHEFENECAGIEGCNALYPWLHQGIESDCLATQEEVRANYFTETGVCTIWFTGP